MMAPNSPGTEARASADIVLRPVRGRLLGGAVFAVEIVSQLPSAQWL